MYIFFCCSNVSINDDINFLGARSENGLVRRVGEGCAARFSKS